MIIINFSVSDIFNKGSAVLDVMTIQAYEYIYIKFHVNIELNYIGLLTDETIIHKG